MKRIITRQDTQRRMTFTVRAHNKRCFGDRPRLMAASALSIAELMQQMPRDQKSLSSWYQSLHSPFAGPFCNPHRAMQHSQAWSGLQHSAQSLQSENPTADKPARLKPTGGRAGDLRLGYQPFPFLQTRISPKKTGAHNSIEWKENVSGKQMAKFY